MWKVLKNMKKVLLKEQQSLFNNIQSKLGVKLWLKIETFRLYNTCLLNNPAGIQRRSDILPDVV